MIVGVLGGGQLGRMLGLAGIPLGLRFRFLDPVADAPARDVGELVVGDFRDAGAVRRFVEQGESGRAKVVTYEFENVPAQAVGALADTGVRVCPPTGALRVAQDRLSEKTLFRELGIPTPAFEAVTTLDELRAAAERVTLPAVLKTRREGYDGKGQRVIRHAGEIDAAWQAIGSAAGSGGLILERFVAFQREISVIGVRGQDGCAAFYPIVENVHERGMLRVSTALNEPGLQREAEAICSRVLSELDYVGVLAIELFVTASGLVGNEMAPRVHNSGHWTIEGAVTSQFENHLRAILGWPLGATGMAASGCSAMVNLIGRIPPLERIWDVEGARVHVYGKVPKAGRKVGHIGVTAPDEERLRKRLNRLIELADPVW